MDIDYEDQSLVSPESLAIKKHSFDEVPHRSLSSGGSDHCSPLFMRNSVAESIKIVVFSAKINLLMPFGPLAILVDQFSGHHVSSILYFYQYFLDHQMNVWLFIYYCKCLSGLGLFLKLIGHRTIG